MALFQERGYEATTVAQIAERAGLTERTFFRYFRDKREVLFAGSPLLVDAMLDAVRACPDTADAQELVVAALHAAADFLPSREHARLRQFLLEAHDELMERELIKMARLSQAVATALREHHVPDLAARIAAESGIAVFKVAFSQWVAADRGTLRQHNDKVLAEQQHLLAH